jgi:hypothetical protein
MIKPLKIITSNAGNESDNLTSSLFEFHEHLMLRSNQRGIQRTGSADGAESDQWQ